MEKKYVCREIRRIDNLLKRDFLHSCFKQKIDDITGNHSWIIGFLAENKDRDIFQRDIEETFSIRPSTVSNILQLMEKKGLITRESVDYDARLKKLVLTDKSLKIHCLMLDDMEKREKHLTEGITKKELDMFFEVLKKIENNI